MKTLSSRPHGDDERLKRALNNALDAGASALELIVEKSPSSLMLALHVEQVVSELSDIVKKQRDVIKQYNIDAIDMHLRLITCQDQLTKARSTIDAFYRPDGRSAFSEAFNTLLSIGAKSMVHGEAQLTYSEELLRDAFTMAIVEYADNLNAG